MKFYDIAYYLGIVLENSYRILKVFVPMMLVSLVNPLLWKNYASAIILCLIIIGGIFYEFKLTDYFKDGNTK